MTSGRMPQLQNGPLRAAPINPGKETACRKVHNRARKVPVCAVLPHCGAIGATSALRETSRKLPRSCPSGSQRRPPWVGGGPLCQPLPPWPTSGAVPPCKACRQPLVPGLVWAGWHEASPLNRATLAVFGGGEGGPECPPGRPGVGPLCPSPPWPPLARPRATGCKGGGLGWLWGCSD